MGLLQGNWWIGQLERLSDGVDDRGEYSLGGKRRLQALTQAREHCIRVVALAIHQAIDHPLEPGAQRLKEDRDEARSKQGDKEIPRRMQQRAQDAYHEDIHTYHNGGEDTIDQGAVDDDVGIEEAVTAEGHAQLPRLQ